MQWSLCRSLSPVGDRGRSKKWKEMLRLPPVAQCLCLRDEIGEGEGGNALTMHHGCLTMERKILLLPSTHGVYPATVVTTIELHSLIQCLCVCVFVCASM